jgi:hypothetical protein
MIATSKSSGRYAASCEPTPETPQDHAGSRTGSELTLLAGRTNTEKERLARSLLSQAIDEADVDARRIVELLDGIPGAFERARLGLEQARAGETIAADELSI